MRYIFLTLLLVMFASPVWGEEYYVRADGSGSNPTCNLLSLCCPECWDIEDVNAAAATLIPGDTIYFCDDDGVFRDQLDIPESGTVDNVYTYKNAPGDTPIISGADVLSGAWTEEGDYWYIAQSTDPHVVWMDDTPGNEYAAKADLAAQYDWFWDDPNDRLYIYTDGTDTNPQTLYTGHGVEVGVASRPYCINLNGKDYITIDGLTLHIADAATGAVPGRGIVRVPNSDHITIQNCTIEGSAHSGIYIDVTSDDVNILNNTITYSAYQLVFMQDISGEVTLYNTDVWVDNSLSTADTWYVTGQSNDPMIVWMDNRLGTYVATEGALDAEFEWYWDSGSEYLYIYSTTNPNDAYSSPGVEEYHGPLQASAVRAIKGTTNLTVDGNTCSKNNRGISMDTKDTYDYSVSNATISNNSLAPFEMGVVASDIAGDIIIELNDINGVNTGNDDCMGIDTGCGNSANLHCPHTTGVIIRYNRIYDYQELPLINDGYCIALDFGTANAQVYYNILSGCNSRGVGQVGETGRESTGNQIWNNVIYDCGVGLGVPITSTGAEFRNNIVYTTSVDDSYIELNSTDAGSGFISSNNIFYPGTEEKFWIKNSQATCGDEWCTLAQFKTYVSDTTSVNDDPLLVNVSGGDFHLSSTSSPAYNTGTDVGLLRDYENKGVGIPDIGGIEYTETHLKGAGGTAGIN